MGSHNEIQAHLEFKTVYSEPITDPIIYVTLGKLYPLLIIINATLDNLMWLSQDLSLTFIYFVCIQLCMMPLDGVTGNINDLGCNNTEYLKFWVSVVSFTFLSFSLGYYIQSIYVDLRDSDPPTTEDILTSLKSIISKIEVLKLETLRGYESINLFKLFLLFVALIPLQIFIFDTLTLKTYLRYSIGFFLLYHSPWMQTTFKIFWRLYLIRVIYYIIYYSVNPTRYIRRWPKVKKLNNIVSYSKNLKLATCLPFPISLQNVDVEEQTLLLQKLYPREKFEEMKLNLNCNVLNALIVVMDVTIEENERKAVNENKSIWSKELYIYEKTNHTMLLGNRTYSTISPLEIENTISDLKDLGWLWLDDSWHKSDWIYNDSEWIEIGLHDSQQCFTRCRNWKRRIYKIEKHKK